MPDLHPHLSLILQLWAPIGVFAAILFGHYLARSWDRKRWLLDCRKQEFKEVVSLMTVAAVAHVHLQVEVELAKPLTSDRLRALDEVHDAAIHALSDRIYIVKDLEELNASHRYMDAIQAIREGDKQGIATEQLRFLISEIVKRAHGS